MSGVLVAQSKPDAFSARQPSHLRFGFGPVIWNDHVLLSRNNPLYLGLISRSVGGIAWIFITLVRRAGDRAKFHARMMAA